MKKNVARILRYALEQLVIVERLKSVTAEVTKGTGRAVASIHNALWLLKSEDSEVPAVMRLRRYPSTKAEAEALQEFLDTDVVIHESIIKKKYEESFDLPATPPQADPPGGWTPEAIDQAAFKPQVGPIKASDTKDANDPELIQSVAIKPLVFYSTLWHGIWINESERLGLLFQYTHSPAMWRFGDDRDLKHGNVPWHECEDGAAALKACNTKWYDLLSKYVTVEQPKPEIELPEKVIRWIALGKHAENVVANEFYFGKKDIDRVDSELGVYAKQALDAVEACMKQS